MKPHVLDELTTQQHAGIAVGLTSVCSAHPLVLDEAIRFGAAGNHVVLIEATCNQVNQEGGYTGQSPEQFRRVVTDLAAQHGLDPHRLVLGGDHLGPNPWRHQPMATAMSKADELVRSFVLAGYTKIHLDASMRCADDDPDAPLPAREIADRTGRLAAVAERAATDADVELPRYVIGTEVPVPGGGQSDAHGIHVSTSEDVAETIALAQGAFGKYGVGAAWDRVRCVVAQPGVEFSDAELFEYDKAAASSLAGFIGRYQDLVFEAHSTDYQTESALRSLIEDHFAVLKVGPGLTFAYREGVFGLSLIEDEIMGASASGVRGILDAVMVADPQYWRGYYPDDAAFARKYSRSDRSRYYWPRAEVVQAVGVMVDNLRGRTIPAELVSQFLPVQYGRLREGLVSLDPLDLLRDKVREVLEQYLSATSTL